MSVTFRKRGWQFESYRHALARQGVKTSRQHHTKRRRQDALVNLWSSDSKFKSKNYYLAAQESHGFMAKHGETGFQGRVGETVILAEKHKEGNAYPVTPEDVKRALENVPVEDRKGLKVVEFVEPRDSEQRGAWAQYVRSKHKILIFAQPQSELQDIRRVRKHMKEYVLPHEIAHHTALEVHHITDSDISMAEARADGGAFGFDVRDRDVKQFKPLHEA